ncbi:PREDICTED: leucine-rich repeat and immunoglobulin-like domain-containing nogo receptor-interacting protein 3 [Branchiostoma belcheri]|uniref:Leucine-rich repeat and immunoglobulin-like domain-containing nogo receptor-interacting protein 3 n=1 Tax=Branchiostoma belcheri TaxID=7741 RepID=A0A6P4Y3B7_BRABE|nr:PREDICTED: leucine-rich repeat and immunoglobulin-like domain-containing nogo receptor-interacting protein 3 [Branchiostoma belcheri]
MSGKLKSLLVVLFIIFNEMGSATPQLQSLDLGSNQIANIQQGVFTNLPQLQTLYLTHNQIANIHRGPGALSGLPQLRRLSLDSNQMETLPSAYSMLSSIPQIYLRHNPWWCDCRMLPFLLKMSGSRSFEYQIICSQPDMFQGKKLRDINPEDLKCTEPTILSFHRVDNDTLAQGETLHLVCEASGMPKPDITVTLPSGLNTTAEPGGRVEVKNTTATVTISGVTAADAGQYTCITTNPAGSASATLSVNVHLSTTTTFNVSPSLSTGTTGTSTHPTSNSNLASSAPIGSTPSEILASSKTFSSFSSSVPVDFTSSEHHVAHSPTSSPPVNTSSTPSDQTESDPTFSVPILFNSSPSEEPESDPDPIATIVGTAAAIVLIGCILLTICWKKWSRNRSIVAPEPGVVRNSTDTTPGVVYNSTDTTPGVVYNSTDTSS